MRAFFDTCRHRGARLCIEPRGHATRLVCPYHQWTYALDGRLIGAGRMHDGFDKSLYRLKPVHVGLVAGMIYICLAETPPDFEPFRAAVEPLLAPHNLKNAKVAHVATLIEDANWKLVMENARECYHCRQGHPELVHVFRDNYTSSTLNDAEPDWVTSYRARNADLGLLNGPFRGGWFEAERFPLAEGIASLTMDGKPAVKKLLCETGGGDIGSMRWAAEPHCFNHALADYVFLFEAMPINHARTLVTAKWLVHKDAAEGVDYDIAALTELWNITNLQDKALAENNQRGVHSRAYAPGPYSQTDESKVLKFVDWYCGAAADYLEGAG